MVKPHPPPSPMQGKKKARDFYLTFLSSSQLPRGFIQTLLPSFNAAGRNTHLNKIFEKRGKKKKKILRVARAEVLGGNYSKLLSKSVCVCGKK